MEINMEQAQAAYDGLSVLDRDWETLVAES